MKPVLTVNDNGVNFITETYSVYMNGDGNLFKAVPHNKLLPSCVSQSMNELMDAVQNSVTLETYMSEELNVGSTVSIVENQLADKVEDSTWLVISDVIPVRINFDKIYKTKGNVKDVTIKIPVQTLALMQEFGLTAEGIISSSMKSLVYQKIGIDA